MTLKKVLLNGFIKCLYAGAWIVGICTVLALFDDWFWPANLAVQFRVQFLLAELFLCLSLALHRRFWASLVCGLTAILNLAFVWPYVVATFKPHDSSLVAGGASGISVLQINLNYKNDNFQDTLNYIAEVDPDVLLLEEVTPVWQEKIIASNWNVRYPQRIFEARTDTMGIGMMSKLSMRDLRIVRFGGSVYPSVCGVIEDNDRKGINLIHSHVMAPVTTDRWREQARQMDEIGNYAESLSGPTMLCGDLNSAPWTAAFQRMLHSGRLTDSQLNSGLQASWPTGKPIVVIRPLNLVFAPDIAWLRYAVCLPLDHVLVNSTLNTHDRRLGKSIGSDHLPVWIRISAVDRQ